MEKIKVNVQWCDKNFGASLGDNVPGSVVVTAKSFDELRKQVEDALRFHVDSMLTDGDLVPQWLAASDYEFEWHYADTATLLRVCEPYISMAAISRETGINQHLLSHYANKMKRPRPQQHQKIVEGIHRIGQRLITVV